MLCSGEFHLCDLITLIINNNTDLLHIERRDQNFGLNELAAVQDVRNDFNLQDIGGEDPASKDRGKLNIIFIFMQKKTS